MPGSVARGTRSVARGTRSVAVFARVGSVVLVSCFAFFSCRSQLIGWYRDVGSVTRAARTLKMGTRYVIIVGNQIIIFEFGELV